MKALRLLAALSFLPGLSAAFAAEAIWIPMKVSSLFGGEKIIKL